MCGGSEAVDPDPLGVARHSVGAVANQCGAEQRCNFEIAVFVWKGETIPGVGDREICIAAVDLESRESRLVAEILVPASAVAARPAGPAEPGNTNALSDFEIRHPRADRFDGPNDLVARHDWKRRVVELIIDEMQVGSAYTACAHRDPQLTGSWITRWDFIESQTRAISVVAHCSHANDFSLSE